MFALSDEFKDLSPQVMRFRLVWIYDCTGVSNFWKNKIRSEKAVLTEDSAWKLICKFYGIHLFSSLQELENLSKTYFEEFNLKVSPQQQLKVYTQLRRLGLTKVGHLKKIPDDQIQRRWGKDWLNFFRGVLGSPKAVWPWIPHRKIKEFRLKKAFDFGVCDSAILIEESLELLLQLSKEQSQIHLRQIDIFLGSQEEGADFHLPFLFHSSPLLAQSFDWLKKLFILRFSQIELLAPLSQIEIKLLPAEAPRAQQLHLFQTKPAAVSVSEITERLSSLGAKIFQPQGLPSRLPERSWHKVAPKENFKISTPPLYYPLIQHRPKEIPQPRAELYLVEQLVEFEASGEELRRDYFVAFMNGRWRWIFKDQTQKWFQQGLI
ncbi:MAG: hypothetical protein EA369_04745 [Bradymonadales bacterium]|nr:MAG: hypothetical protein EA369_04745 [Bradymonadales bacterium]